VRFEGDPDFDAAFAARGVPSFTVTRRSKTTGASGSVTAMARRVAVTREMAGDIPESASLVGGAVSANCVIDLDVAAGAPSAFKKADRDAWLGAPVTVAAGYNLDPLTVFTGVARELATSEAANGGSLSLLDGSDGMRAAVTLQPFGSYWSRPGGERARYPTNLSAVVVAALHRCGIRVTPDPGAGAVISVPLVFGALADVGWTVPWGVGVPDGADWLTPGPFGPAPAGLGGVWSVNAFPAAVKVWGSDVTLYRLDMWVNTAGLTAAATAMAVMRWAGYVLTVNARAGGVCWSVATPTGGTVTSPWRSTAAGWARCTVDVRTSGTVTSWLAGTRSELPLGSALPGVAAEKTEFRLELPGFGRLQQVSVVAATGEQPNPTGTFTPQADVDRALLDVDCVPVVDGRVAWEVCKEVAAAEFGMVGFDEDGRFVFRNRASLNGSTVPVATWGTDLVDDLAGSAAVDSVRTRITGSCRPRWFVDAGRGAETEASTAEPVAVADAAPALGWGVTTLLLTSADPWVSETGHVRRIAALGEAWDVEAGIVFCDDAGGNARSTRAGLSARLVQLSPYAAAVLIRNETGFLQYPVWPAEWVLDEGTPFGFSAGDPAIWVNGRAVRGEFAPVSVDVTASAAALAAWGERTLELGESEWRQNPADVKALADQLAADLASPRLELRDMTVPADLRWQVGDLIKLTDWAGRVPDIQARITRIQLSLDYQVENGITGTYSLRALPG
jgi:hypothetical protein